MPGDDRVRVPPRPGLGERHDVVDVAEAGQQHQRAERDDLTAGAAHAEPALRATGVEDLALEAQELLHDLGLVDPERGEGIAEPGPVVPAVDPELLDGAVRRRGIAAVLHHDVPRRAVARARAAPPGAPPPRAGGTGRRGRRRRRPPRAPARGRPPPRRATARDRRSRRARSSCPTHRGTGRRSTTAPTRWASRARAPSPARPRTARGPRRCRSCTAECTGGCVTLQR